jgi:hypothetical protein
MSLIDMSKCLELQEAHLTQESLTKMPVSSRHSFFVTQGVSGVSERGAL